MVNFSLDIVQSCQLVMVIGLSGVQFKGVIGGVISNRPSA